MMAILEGLVYVLVCDLPACFTVAAVVVLFIRLFIR